LTTEAIRLIIPILKIDLIRDMTDSQLEFIDNDLLQEITIFLTKNKTLSPITLNGRVEAFRTGPAKSLKKSYLQTGLLEDDVLSLQNINLPIPPANQNSSSDSRISSSSSCSRSRSNSISVGNISSNANHSNESDIYLKEHRSRSYSLSSFPVKRTIRRRAPSLGDLKEVSTQQLLQKLTTTLNEIHPDYEFGNSKLEQFVVQEPFVAQRRVNSHLSELLITNPSFLGKLWGAIDMVANFRRCECFQFQPDINDDTQHENLWSFHYFFYNKDDQTLVYLTCEASRQHTKYFSDDDEDDEDCDEYDDVMDVDCSEEEEDDRSVGSMHEDSGDDLPQWDGVI